MFTKQQSKNYLFLTLLIAVLVVLSIALAAWWNPMSWGIWNSIFHKQTQNPIVCTMDAKLCPDGSYVSRQGPKCEFADCPKLIGGDKDAHGCLPAAGYSWCEVKQKCLRVWEEPCDATATEATRCTDSDGGKNIYVRGVATTKDSIHGGTIHMTSDDCTIKDDTDYVIGAASCSGNNCYINESYCEEAKIWTGTVDGHEYIECPSGCKDGTCIK
jgi:hypothetical protein